MTARCRKSSSHCNPFERKMAAVLRGHFAILTRVTSLTRLLARTKSPSLVTSVLSTMLPPPGIAQLWNFAVLGSKRTTVFGADSDSLYQIMSSLVMARRRGRDAGSGRVNSRISSVFGSTRATLLVPNWTTNRLPLESNAMPYGRDFGVGGESSLISPLFGSSRPMRLAFCTVNQTMPALSMISVCGSFASGSGILYSVTLPVFGSSLPTSAPVFPVYQMLPALSSTRPCGPEWGVLSGYSLTWPVFGSTRPSTFAICPEYQSDPSRAARGSCGLDPGVCACHAFIDTFTGPGTSTAAGLPVTGKVLAR